MSTRSTTVSISGRKQPGYPTLSFEVSFESTDDLIQKIDSLIETKMPEGSAVDVSVIDVGFSARETNHLMDEWISVV